MNERQAMELYIHEAGSTANSTIVFLHGAGLSGRMWQPQLERLADYHCLAPDLPGQGRSAEIPLVLSDAAERVARLIRERAHAGRAHVVGLSYGGTVAQSLLAAHADVVDHVILSGTSARFSAWLGKVLIPLMNLNAPILRLLKPHQIAALMAWQFGIPHEFRAMLGEDASRMSPQTVLRVSQSFLEIQTPRQTRSPVLVVVGQKETIPAKLMARKLVRTISGARGVMVPGLGHVWNLQSPDLFADTVRAWVTDQPLPGALRPLT